MTFARSAWAAGAELTLVGIIVCYGSFSGLDLLLLLLLGSQSLWIRNLGWSDVGLRRVAVWPTILYALAASVGVLVAIRFPIAPLATLVTGDPVDLSALGEPGDTRAFLVWLARAWTLAAFGEEMVFRGYLIRRVTDLTGDTVLGRVIAVAASSALFGFAHRYLGWGGIVATGMVGVVLAIIYLFGRKNLWILIICHGTADTIALSALYLGHRSLLLPS
jgi:CAAX protease family protein